MVNKARIRAERRPFWSGIELFVFVEEGDKTFMLQNPEKVEIEPHLAILEPTHLIDQDAAQELMDQLWNCGIRPSEGSGSAGAFAAQGKHLEDMRNLVFKGGQPK